MSCVQRCKKPIFRGVFLVLMLVGSVLAWYRVLPIQNTSIFLFGLMWIWTGLSLLGNLNPYFAQKYARRHQLVFAATSIGLGAAWSLLALTPLSHQALPMIVVSLPFLALDFLVFLRNRRACGPPGPSNPNETDKGDVE